MDSGSRKTSSFLSANKTKEKGKKVYIRITLKRSFSKRGVFSLPLIYLFYMTLQYNEKETLSFHLIHKRNGKFAANACWLLSTHGGEKFSDNHVIFPIFR